jgi:hypothetical protein
MHDLDGCYRDMASMHGNYRKVEETTPALLLIGELLEDWGVATCTWLLDRPVSNSGRLKTILGELAANRNWRWRVDLVPNPDTVLIQSEHIVASADSQILDNANRWLNMAKTVIETRIPDAWMVDLSD